MLLGAVFRVATVHGCVIHQSFRGSQEVHLTWLECTWVLTNPDRFRCFPFPAMFSVTTRFLQHRRDGSRLHLLLPLLVFRFARLQSFSDAGTPVFQARGVMFVASFVPCHTSNALARGLSSNIVVIRIAERALKFGPCVVICVPPFEGHSCAFQLPLSTSLMCSSARVVASCLD